MSATSSLPIPSRRYEAAVLRLCRGEIVSAACATDLFLVKDRLPFLKGDFQRWVKDNGLLPD